MLLKQMCLKAFSVGSVLNNILDSAFCTTQQKLHKGLLLLFFLFFVCFVLLCSVSRLVKSISILLHVKTVMRILLII